MPAIPLVDLTTLDLSNVVVPPERIREVLQQRGRFAMLDGILHMDLEAELSVGFKEVRATDWWAEDHVPGRPIFPGALMVEAAAQLCTFDFHQRRPEVATFVGFTGIDKTRFRATVEPDCRMVFVATPHRCRKTMFHYKSQGFVDGTLVFESDISGMVV